MTKFVPILLVGGSGTGKSTTAEDLPVGEVLIINIEDKVMPNKEASKHSTRYVRSLKQILSILNALIDPTTIKDESKQQEYRNYKYVFFDSFTALAEVIEKYCAVTYSGYTQWGKYNELLYDVIHKLKQLPQRLVVTAIPEQKAEGYDETKEYAKVKGKELKYGYLESQFTIVLFTSPEYAEEDRPADDVEAGDMIACWIKYKPSKKNTAKSPVNMFHGKVPNSAKTIFKMVDEYYGYES